MWIYINNNIKRVHWFDRFLYLIDNSSNIYYLDEVQSFIFNEIYTSINSTIELKELVIKTDNAFNVNDVILTCSVIERIIDCLNDLFKTSIDKPTVINHLIISGEKGYCYPYCLEVSVTNRCYNLCKHCYITADMNGIELSYKNLSEVLSYCNSKTPYLILTGGEPLLYKNVTQLINEWGRRYRISVITSTIGLENLADRQIQQISSFQVSIYGSNATEHDSFVQRSGAFVQMISNLKRILKVNPELIVASQAKNNAIEPLEELVKLCISLGVKTLMIGEITPIGRAKNMDLNDYDSRVIQNNIRKMNKKYLHDIHIFIDKKESKNKFEHDNWYFKCGAGRYQWHINENGIIYPCSFMPFNSFVMGSLKDGAFKELICTSKIDALNCKWYRLPEEVTNNLKNRCDRIGNSSL